MSISIQLRKLRRSLPLAWDQIRIVQPTKLALSVAIAALNILWQGHGVLRSFARAPRFVIVAVVAYVITAASEFLWYLATGPSFTGFESPTAEQASDGADTAEHLAAQLRTLPPTELRAEALEFAKELKDFEAGSDREFVKSLAGSPPVAATESEKDEALDKQSTQLFEQNMRTWRDYRERFYRPARAFRDELRKRLGIRNLNSEPRIPALDQAELTGAKPIAQAADYLAGLARRLK